MLGLGWTEMLVIGVVALIFIGPKDLPVVMGRIGKVMGQIRRMGNEFQREINRTTGLDEVRNLRSSITDPLKKTADEIRREFNAMTPQGPKPTGVLKQSDPEVESVVDDILDKAGMPPAKKTNDEIAAEAGFKPTKVAAEPVKAARTTPPTFQDTATAKAASPKPAKPADAPKPARRKAAPKAVTAEAKLVEAKSVAEKPAAAVKAEPKRAAPRKKAVAADVPPAETVATPAKTPRAPRKKPADAAEKS
ncbi:Sec-independent protein translocase protein TatB [Devosia equisanguinis]|uniref:Sec-independent protein translocase protein TatB n=1 Tax=Devosia equisanguinis TaxID=2490941 RepID=A0A3S4D7J8_9HYPH|nr:Sec-independent protein translocase protein TatB [Devosia equisanguinis]VDS06235.1 Sec-independent protein translocase protein TatB [Devosia equisanguinis]